MNFSTITSFKNKISTYIYLKLRIDGQDQIIDVILIQKNDFSYNLRTLRVYIYKNMKLK